MNIPQLIADLAQQGILLQANQDKLSIRSAKGALTPEVRETLATYKTEILSFLQIDTSIEPDDETEGGSLRTIGRLISGLAETATADYRPPIVDPLQMAQKLTVTFRPLPKGYRNSMILNFRSQLQNQLVRYGVTVEPWETATVAYSYPIELPKIGVSKNINVKIVRAGINAIIDVERPPSVLRQVGILTAETLYQTYCRFVAKDRKLSIMQIAELSSWAEEHAAKRIQDPTNTQVITLAELNPQMASPELSYPKKIKIGLNTLIKTFSELVIGISEDQLSILNMNLSDATFPRTEFEKFVLYSLIPKIFVPILPLPLNRFDIGEFDPQASTYAEKLVTLGKELAETGLFPAGSKLSEVIKRKSHRDIIDVIVNGRTGVSYGFVCYIEPPQYVGAREITAAEWETLTLVSGFSASEIRQNSLGRWYLKTKIGQTIVFKQIPDIWLVSSRSGANKTALDRDRDVTRIGLKKRLVFQVAQGLDLAKTDIKPSYDIYVMVAIALASALYLPELIENGAPLIHFHGYPSIKWFQPNEYCVGVNNPSVPCGTYESGIFNFLGMNSLAAKVTDQIALVSLIEPDHGTNIIARDLEYLLGRLKPSCTAGEIELGGKHFSTLKEPVALR
ncbi:hypothetical protein ACQ4M3_26805 [Leptolyngbya sp. AN03gr2]|uniref:TubC N-terminal docking domain-related protein n=1 Tax=unclassified Leptolyngbya TaxID=2650499 RepID=UPI003D315C71